jgi:hypothetical protein
MMLHMTWLCLIMFSNGMARDGAVWKQRAVEVVLLSQTSWCCSSESFCEEFFSSTAGSWCPGRARPGQAAGVATGQQVPLAEQVPLAAPSC